jgi:gas vesicle protein
MSRNIQAIVGFSAGVVAGLAVGYVAAVLLAPDEGAATRLKLQGGANALLAKPRGAADQLQARLQQAMDEGRHAAAETRAALEASSGLRYDGHDAGPRPPTTSI